MSKQLAAIKATNELRQCSAPGCKSDREGVALFCRSHQGIYKQYGHPMGCPIAAKQWAPQRATVAELLTTNADHPGVTQAVQVVSDWVAKAQRSADAYKGAEEVRRLVMHGISARDILATVSAVSLYLHLNPRAVLSDRAADVAVSRAVFALSPRPRRILKTPTGWGSVKKPTSYSPKARASAMTAVGKHLRESLSPFLANVVRSVETLGEQKAQAQAAMAAPLRPSWA